MCFVRGTPPPLLGSHGHNAPVEFAGWFAEAVRMRLGCGSDEHGDHRKHHECADSDPTARAPSVAVSGHETCEHRKAIGSSPKPRQHGTDDQHRASEHGEDRKRNERQKRGARRVRELEAQQQRHCRTEREEDTSAPQCRHARATARDPPTEQRCRRARCDRVRGPPRGQQSRPKSNDGRHCDVEEAELHHAPSPAVGEGGFVGDVARRDDRDHDAEHRP